MKISFPVDVSNIPDEDVKRFAQINFEQIQDILSGNIDDSNISTSFTDKLGIITESARFDFTSSWSTASGRGFWRRVGDTIYLSGAMTLSGVGGSSSIKIQCYPGVFVDSAKIPNTNFCVLGSCLMYDASLNAVYTGIVQYFDDTNVRLLTYDGNLVTASVPFTWAADDFITFDVSAPIARWGRFS